MVFNRNDINFFVSLCELSRKFEIISDEEYYRRLRYLNNLCRGRYPLNLMRRQIREKLTEEVNFEYEGTNVFDDFNNLDSNVFEVVSNDSYRETDPNRYSLITKRKGKYDKWKIVAICDSDPFPSVPHFHGTGKYSNCKLDPYTGLVYKDEKIIGKERLSIVDGMWKDDGFRKVAAEAIKHFIQNVSKREYQGYLNRKRLTNDQMKKLPKKRSGNSEKSF